MDPHALKPSGRAVALVSERLAGLSCMAALENSYAYVRKLPLVVNSSMVEHDRFASASAGDIGQNVD